MPSHTRSHFQVLDSLRGPVAKLLCGAPLKVHLQVGHGGLGGRARAWYGFVR